MVLALALVSRVHPSWLKSSRLVSQANASPAPPAAVIRADGRVATYPNATVVVGTDRGGTLEMFALRERAAVKRGDIIAELEASESRAALAEARARIHEADVQ